MKFVSWAIFEQFSPLGRVNATSLAYRRTTRPLAKDDEYDIPNESKKHSIFIGAQLR